uniref:WW domain-containing protein n=1 Tax=Heliothis virescens TaxID=7102 RepID=A0A2A4JXQ4_HELVI
MNANKKNIGLNNGWILCPSKSFPGKFYYFNVLNGEAAWSLSEPDKKGLKKEITPQVHKIADKSHEYPEPTSLPDETSLTSYDIGDHVKKTDYLRNIPYTQEVPTFGQLAFPKYVAKEPLMTNIVWTPLQLPMFCPDTKKPMSDKVTQTSSIERELFIQTCDIPLCKRFKNYETPFLCFDKRNKILNKPTFDTSTPRNAFEGHEKPTLVTSKSKFIKDSILKLDTILPQVATQVTEVKSVVEKPTLSLGNKVESTPEVEANLEKSDKVLGKLDQTDLRFLLLAKRRKSMDASVETVEKKKLKPSESKTITTPKKKVTFDLGLETGEGLALSDITSMEDFEQLTPPIIETPKTPILNHPPRQLGHKNIITPFTKEAEIPNVATSSFAKSLGLPVRKNTWYIVVDTDVLLLDYELIDNLVLSDPKCKLIIPHAVRADIESLCLGDCRGQQRVINARQLTRKLATPPPHYTV